MEVGAEPTVPEEREFFFPKANPPVTIRAATLAEAEEQLKALSNKEA